MVEDAIKQYDSTEPKSTTNVDDAPTVLPENWDAMEEMMGGWMQGLEITCAGGDSMTIDYTRLGLLLNTGTPPLVFVDRSPSTITLDWSNGEVMNGRETGLSAAAGWKYVWVFRDDTGGATAGLFSATTSLGSVVEPDTDYRFGRLVGAGYWNGSIFTAFLQRQDRVIFPDLGVKQVLTNGRSDATWSSAISLATHVPTLATRLMTVIEVAADAAYGACLVQLAADGSGNYRSHMLRGVVEGSGDSITDTYEQEILTQNLHYYTTEVTNIIRVNIFLAGYWIDI